ncbi:EAL domain-containing protein [Actinoplanes sp. NPDC051411]|uniref:EAL domain-containing protein n=1 Tax=Actinoplanes sp. NPDC051411 TaxID=3155522 RepID=UPI0034168161
METPRPAITVISALATAAVVVVALVLLPTAAAAGLLTAGPAVFAALMLRAVVTGRSAGPRARAVALAGGLVILALAGVASGVTALVVPDALVAGGVPLPAEIPLVSLFFVAGLLVPAVLRPHQRRDPLARLRFGLDALGVSACLVFPVWLLMFSGHPARGAAVTALIVGGGAAATVAVAGAHAVRHRSALQWCAPGAALALVALTALVIAQDYAGKPNASIAALAAAAASNAAGALLWHGSVRIRPDVRAIPPAGGEPPAGLPLLTVPMLGAALAAILHLVNGGRLDSVSIVVGVIGITAVAAREWVSALTLRRHAVHLTDQGNRLRSLVFGSADVAMVLDADLAVRWQSPAAARQFGLSDQDVLGRTVSALVHPDQADAVHRDLLARMSREETGESLPVRLRDGFGRWRETEWTTNGSDPAGPGRSLVVHVRDVGNLRDLEQALRQATFLDPQTSLANREGLRRAGELIPDAGAVIVIELGGLTAIGDVHGPDLADVVVAEAARRLRTGVETADVPARLGENRFAVLTRCGAVRAHLLASQLVNALTVPYTAAGTIAHLSAWAGLADLVPETGTDEVIRQAVLALRSVRSGPPGAAEWYDEQMESRLLRRSTLEQDLPQAVARGALELTFQPVVDLSSDRAVGVEALVGWRHPTLGPVPGPELLALADDLGLLGKVTQWALHRSCRLLLTWRERHESLWLALNVRPRALSDPTFQAGLHNALELFQIPPSALVIGVAERDLASSPAASPAQPPADDLAGQLGRLRADGIRTAIDHFGAGPTSLSRLRILPIDLLKIDREVFDTSQAGAVMDVTVALGRRLGLEIIADGLENEADLDAVRAAGCRLGQGALLGRPMFAEHLEAFLSGVSGWGP